MYGTLTVVPLSTLHRSAVYSLLLSLPLKEILSHVPITPHILLRELDRLCLNDANGSTFTLYDALYVPGIKKNLLLVFAPAKIGLVVKFLDDRYTVHDLSYGDIIVAFGTLCRGLYKLTMYGKCVEDLACAVMDLQAILDAKLWHARFGHLNFASLLRLQKFEMVSSLPKLEAPIKHVCEGCTLGKMQRASFPKDGPVRAERKL